MSNTSSNHAKASEVPYRTIIATIGLVVITYLLWLMIKQVSHILELIIVSAFFAIALNPAVDFLEHRFHFRRGLASSVVFVLGAIAFTCLLYLFIRPLVDQTAQFVDHFPQMVDDAKNGKGTIGELVQHYHVSDWVEKNQSKLREGLTSSTGSVVTVASTVAATIASLLTVLVLTFLMILEGPRMIRGPLIFFSEIKQLRIRKVAADSAKAVTGYVTGNLLISLIAGTVTFLNLTLTGVPFAVVLAVWVAFADLIPLLGATLGAIPTIGVAFLHSTNAGIITVIVYVVYQQVENHILQPTIMAKTVKMNPLTVLVSVLIGVELAGLLGALFAIPIAGIIQVIGRDIVDNRTGRLKNTPTTGEEETPITASTTELKTRET